MKKILIYGEYSGLGKSISSGLNKIGYQCDVFSFTGDGFKKIDSKLKISGTNSISKFFSFIKMIPEIMSYDIIFIMNPLFLRLKLLGPILLLLFKVKGIKLFLFAAGDDVEYIKCGKAGLLGEWPYCDISLPSENYFSTILDKIVHYLTCKSVCGIIPFAPDYKISWEHSKYSNKVGPIIPFPCDGIVCNRVPKIGKLKISHGINRVDFKGTVIVKEALNRIVNKYPNLVEISYPDKMVFSDYIKYLKTIDICIDQTKGNGYGMNALYALFSGCIVFAPTRESFNKIMKFDSCPIVPIENNVDSIYQQVERVIFFHEDYLNKISTLSQEHAVKYHSPEVVARKIECAYINRSK